MRPLFLLTTLCWPTLAATQTTPGSATAVPQVVSSATSEVELKPDRAVLLLSVESRGTTAAAAGAETSRKQRSVLDALRALGIPPEAMNTAGLEIHPELVYPGENKPPRISGYVARSSLRVEVRNIEQTGALIDAALAKEATGIGSLQFTSSKLDEARRQALEGAVSRAKADADAMARAAGGSLGALLEISAQPSYDRTLPVEMSAVRSAGVNQAPTPIIPGQLHVSASVTARWGYVAGRP